MRTVIAALVFLAAFTARAQSVNIQVDPNMMGINAEVREESTAQQSVRTRTRHVEEHNEQSFGIRYETNEEGNTLIRVLQPEGARVEIWDGSNNVASEDIPMSVQAHSGVFYRVVIQWPDGAMFDKKFSAKHGKTMSLWVRGPNVQAAPPPQPVGPVAMSAGDFGNLKAAIEAEAFSDQKLGVLQAAAPHAWFTAAQVGALIDLYSFSNDKLAALGTVKDHIVDRQNSYQIPGHFTFSVDKEQAQQMLR